MCLKAVLVVLSLWFVASIVTIVVWATAPDFKSAAQCRSELKDLNVRHEGSKVVCQKNQEALEQMVREEREEGEKLRGLIVTLQQEVNETNATLQESLQERLVLLANITALLETVDTLQEKEANLTARLEEKQDEVDALQQNVTQAALQTSACFSLRDAAEAQTKAAESQLQACHSQQEYLQKQLAKCKASDAEASRQTTPQQNSAPAPTASGPGLSVVQGLVPGLVLVLATVHLLFT